LLIVDAEWFTNRSAEIFADVYVGRRAAGLKSGKLPFEWLDPCGHLRRGYWSLLLKNAQKIVADQVTLPPWLPRLNWSGQYEYMQRRKKKLTYGPLDIGHYYFLLSSILWNFSRRVAIIMGTLPFAIGGQYLAWMYLSVQLSRFCGGVGFIALGWVAGGNRRFIMLVF